MPEKLKEIVRQFQKIGGGVSDRETEEIWKYSLRKMEVAGIKNPEEYMPLLYRDEVKDYIFRRGVNAIMELKRMKKECESYELA